MKADAITISLDQLIPSADSAGFFDDASTYSDVKDTSVDFGSPFKDFDFVSDCSSHRDGIDHPIEPPSITCAWDFTRDDVHQLLQPWDVSPQVDLQAFDVHPMSRIALDQCKPLDFIDAIDIFTDGSHVPARDSEPSRSAWAFVIFGRGHNHDGSKGSQWFGYHSGIVTEHTDPHHDQTGIGVLEPSAYESERSALWWAAAYLLQCPHSCPACLHFDSTAAGGTASGLASCSDSTDDFGLGATFRGIFQMLQQHRAVTFRHVKGHTGQAGNELADAVATAQGNRVIPDGTPDLSLPMIKRTSKHFMQWLFAFGHANDRPQLGNHTISFPGFWPATALPFEWRPGDLCRPSIHCNIDVSFKLATYNVMTLRRHGAVASMKQHLMDSQVHVAGFQETRDSQSRLWKGSPFIRICAAATPQGVGGLQLWVSSAMPFAHRNGRPVFFQKQDLTVAFDSPRLLIVHAHSAGLHFAFIVGHAPHSGDEAKANPHLQAVTKALHHTTWFVCEQETAAVAVTKRGSRPGDPIADVLFNLVMSRAMESIETKLAEQGLLETFEVDNDQPLPYRCRGVHSTQFSGQAWVDDLIFMTSCDDANLLCQRVSQIISIVQTELATMGIKINLSKGKSEAIVHLAGPGSRQLRRELHLEQGSMIRFADAEGCTQTLQAGSRYKYLGSILSIHGTCTADIKHRAGQTFAMLKIVRRPIFKNVQLEPKVKQLVLHSIVLSKMMATSGAWIFDTRSAEQAFTKTIMRIYRYVFALLPGWSREQRYSNEDVVTTLGVLWPSELLHVHRLRSMISAVRLGTIHIWALLQADQQWLSHVEQALAWLSQQVSMNVGTPPEALQMQAFIDMAEETPQRARRLLRRAQRAALNQRIRQHGARKWHAAFTEQLLHIGFTFPVDPARNVAGPNDSEEGFLCSICAKHFRTPHSAATHMMRAHQVHAEHFLWSNRTSCLCCMQEFHTCKRLSAHFQHGGRRCLEQLKLRYQHPDILEQRAAGPDVDHLPFAPIAGPVEQWNTETVDEFRGWRHKPRRPRALPMMARQVRPEEDASTPEFPTCFEPMSVAMPRHIPMPVQFILHFFSGRRRQDDFQHFLEAMADQHHLNLRVLSLDVAIDARIGNLASDEAFTFWNDKAKRGYIYSFLAGPPCETFSKARFRGHGPPPLRSFLHRWGLPGLLGRYHRQVECGSFLWRFTVSMLTSQISAGKGGVFEHPAAYDVSEGPCQGGVHIRCFPEIVALLQWPSLKLFEIDQGKFGQRCRKPTGFMILNHAEAGRIFHAMTLPPHQWQLSGVEMGWDAANQRFATAPLKEYPGHLCATLATIMLSGLASPPRDDDVEIDHRHYEAFVSSTAHLHQLLDTCERGPMQPDWFQG
eukprot:Skav216369  [mRNA]  locus=scaffold1517:213218:218875:+ [translate_table: standard]